MEAIIIDAATVACIVTLLCTATITQRLRDFVSKYTSVLECCFCTSFWVTPPIDLTPTYFATVTVANVWILLIHWAIASTNIGDQT